MNIEHSKIVSITLIITIAIVSGAYAAIKINESDQSTTIAMNTPQAFEARAKLEAVIATTRDGQARCVTDTTMLLVQQMPYNSSRAYDSWMNSIQDQAKVACTVK